MRRQSSRRTVRRDYAAYADVLPRTRNNNATSAADPGINPPTPTPPAQPTSTPTPPLRPPPRPRRQRDTPTLPPAPQEPMFADEEGGATCTVCQVFFGESELAASKNNRHHPACNFFDRSVVLANTHLRYDVLLSWADTLIIRDLKTLLKMYYQKTSARNKASRDV